MGPKCTVHFFHRPTSVGGHAHHALLYPGGFARQPLSARIPALKVPEINFIYGVNDWMGPDHARRVQQEMSANTSSASSPDGSSGSWWWEWFPPLPGYDTATTEQHGGDGYHGDTRVTFSLLSGAYDLYLPCV